MLSETRKRFKSSFETDSFWSVKMRIHEALTKFWTVALLRYIMRTQSCTIITVAQKELEEFLHFLCYAAKIWISDLNSYWSIFHLRYFRKTLKHRAFLRCRETMLFFWFIQHCVVSGGLPVVLSTISVDAWKHSTQENLHYKCFCTS